MISRQTYRSAFLTFCFALALLFSPANGRAQESGVYTVANLAIDVQAKDAVMAKEKAMKDAKRQALETIFRRIAPFNSSDRFPDISAKAIDNLIEGFAVQKERNSATRYLATLDFTFDAAAVRNLMAEKGIPLSDQQAETITVIPVYVSGGEVDHTGRDPWRSAWNTLDLTHAIVPVRLARSGPSLTMETLSGLLGGDPKAFVELRDKVKAEKLVLAIAEPTADGKTLTSRMFGFDRVGAIGVTRHDPVVNGDLKATATYAAGISQGILGGRWKLVQAPVGSSSAGGGEAVAIDMYVEFSGMGQWKDIRTRLTKVPGVNGIDVKSLSARSAHVGLQFPGGAESLAGVLGSHGLSLDGGNGGALVLRSN